MQNLASFCGFTALTAEKCKLIAMVFVLRTTTKNPKQFMNATTSYEQGKQSGFDMTMQVFD